MSKDMGRSGRVFRIWAMVLMLEIAVFSLACRLANTTDAGRITHGSMIEALLGDSRLAISESFYDEADTFFHKGVGHYRPKAFTDSFVKLAEDITPTTHVHLQDKNIAEITPWLYFATRLDPQNVTAYAVAAFWLASEVKRPDLAEQVLAEARRANPQDYRVYLEAGRLAIRQDNLRRAARFLETALKLWPGQQDPEDRQTRLDHAEIFMYRGLLYENDGEMARAQDMYRRVLALFPGRATMRKRLKYLETHGRSPSPPFELWQSMLISHEGVCHGEDEKNEHRY